MADNNQTPITNPLQVNNTIISIVAYVSGLLAAKLPWFDFATWNYIIMSVLGVLAVATPALFNRKQTVVGTVAKMPEVKEVGLNRSNPNSKNLASVSPDNVVMK